MDVAGLELADGFASAVALNATGDRLAIGAYGDDGAGNAATDSGAVYLYGFADGNFSGGSLLATVGKGYTGGNNVDVANLGNQDGFGVAAAFNAAGDLLAVGAFGDDGAGNLAPGSGAVYLFGFADNNFTAGSLQATVSLHPQSFMLQLAHKLYCPDKTNPHHHSHKHARHHCLKGAQFLHVPYLSIQSARFCYHTSSAYQQKFPAKRQHPTPAVSFARLSASLRQ